ncbi:hypothetical protein SAMN04244571_02961, partial [Azotobacter beijerinckii]
MTYEKLSVDKRLTKSQVIFLAESGLDSIECLHPFRAGVLA